MQAVPLEAYGRRGAQRELLFDGGTFAVVRGQLAQTALQRHAQQVKLLRRLLQTSLSLEGRGGRTFPLALHLFTIG